MVFTRRLLLFFILFLVTKNKVHAGYCNTESEDCGQQCSTQDDCPGGDCTDGEVECPEDAQTRYCDAEFEECVGDIKSS